MKQQLQNNIWMTALSSVLGLITTIVPNTAHAQKSQPKLDAKTYVGTGSCSSSNCHGSVAPLTTGTVLQNEYVTWQRHDHHSQAFKVLANEDSQIIAKHLGLGNPQREPLCLKCHATYVPEVEQRGEKFQLEDGVSCEACHGAASGWLSTHTVKGTTHAQNVERGMIDLVPLDKRTPLCLSCHFGSDDRNVDHRLIGAGHPRLSFELDTFESIMPRHWEADKDYQNRKGGYASANAWLQGQAAQARESAEKFLSKKRATNGVFPEFTLFGCYSCHHSLTEDQWKSREYGERVGEPVLNLASFHMLREALKVLKPAAGAELERQLAGVHKNFKEGKGAATFTSLKKLASDPAVAQPNLTADQRARLFRQLSSFAASTPFLPYETAEQVAMALSSLVAEDQSKAEAVKDELERMFDALKDEEGFDPTGFTAAAQRLGRR